MIDNQVFERLMLKETNSFKGKTRDWSDYCDKLHIGATFLKQLRGSTVFLHIQTIEAATVSEHTLTELGVPGMQVERERCSCCGARREEPCWPRWPCWPRGPSQSHCSELFMVWSGDQVPPLWGSFLLLARAPMEEAARPRGASSSCALIGPR